MAVNGTKCASVLWIDYKLTEKQSINLDNYGTVQNKGSNS